MARTPARRFAAHLLAFLLVAMPLSVARASIDNDDRMDANNLDMAVTNHGSIAYDLLHVSGGLVYPRGSAGSVVYAAGIWIGARVAGETRVALGKYSQEYAPGPMAGGTFQVDRPEFRNYRIERGVTSTEDYLNWPFAQGAPRDSFGNPLVLGDVTIWSVFNDADSSMHVNAAGRTAPLGVEVQQSVFAFNRSGPLANMIFLRWKLFNKGANTLDSAYVSVWSDPDLGGFTDDLVGCDTLRSMGFAYNATNSDQVYGDNPPAVGFGLLRGAVARLSPGVYDTLGMTSFVKYISGTDPTSAAETYNSMRGRNADGSSIHVLDNPAYPATTYMVSGLYPEFPSSVSNWLDSDPGDRRMLVTTGPFTMAVGDSQEIIAALVVGQGGDRLASVSDLRNKYDVAALVYQSGLLIQEPPTAVAATLRESSVVGGVVRLVWSVSGGTQAQAWVERRTTTTDWSRVAPALPVGSGRIAYEDHDITPGERYAYRLRVPEGGAEYVTEEVWIAVPGEAAPRAVDLRVSGANPARGDVWLRLGLPAPGPSRVTILDLRGRVVARIAPGAESAGWHSVRWDGRNRSGQRAASGVYFARLETSDGVRSTRFVLVR